MVVMRTEVIPVQSNWDFGYRKSMMLIGSCFTENIGMKLADVKYPIDVNPFGIIYNPLSVANSLEMLIDKRMFSENDLFYHNELYNSYAHHGRFSDLTPEKTLEGINTQIEASSEFIRKASFLTITFGTAWIYELRKDNRVVSNCHKVPSAEFNRRLLNVDEIVARYQQLFDSIRKINPDIRFILTVSPVRHVKDSIHGNQISKSILLLAINQLEIMSDVSYFPSYEIMLDDLRDYRFYDADLLHPNQQAIDYIWEKFMETYFDDELKELSIQIHKLVKARNHRPFHESTQQYQKFLSSHLRKVNHLLKMHPEINLKEEISFFSRKLK
ncbi:MAG: GSCFA domain-containing protein [Bacteroidales bacterium]|nr:GSCFA domain-containing protein [Bacteroidales bacterium]